MVLTQEFFNHLLILLGLMYGFTTLKISVCKPFDSEGEAFDWKKLLQGTVKQLLVISGVLVVYLVGCKCGESLLLVQIGETKLTLQTAIDVTILAVATFYAAKYIKNLAVFFGISDKLNDSNVKEVDVQTIVDCCTDSDGNSSSSSCEHGELIGYCYAVKTTTSTTTTTTDTTSATSSTEEKG